MSDAELLVEGADKLVARLGYWPDFHDWEVHQFAVNRNGFAADCMIQIETPPGSAQELSVTLNCADVNSIELCGFNHQNVIGALTFVESMPEPNLRSKRHSGWR